jgi:hypothetical protein
LCRVSCQAIQASHFSVCWRKDDRDRLHRVLGHAIEQALGEFQQERGLARSGGAEDEECSIHLIEHIDEVYPRWEHPIRLVGALHQEVEGGRDGGRALGQVKLDQYLVDQRVLDHTSNPDGPNLLRHGLPIALLSGLPWLLTQQRTELRKMQLPLDGGDDPLELGLPSPLLGKVGIRQHGNAARGLTGLKQQGEYPAPAGGRVHRLGQQLLERRPLAGHPGGGEHQERVAAMVHRALHVLRAGDTDVEITLVETDA